MIMMSIVLLLGSMIALASINRSINTLQASKGSLIGNQLQTIDNALSTYISNNQAALISGAAIAGVTTPLKPTIAELKGLNLLSASVSNIPSYGTGYSTAISVSPSGCTSNCQVIGSVWLVDPVRGANNSTTDINLLGSAVSASTLGQIGFSTLSRPGIISGPGWTATNPDLSSRAGILYATTNLAKVTSPQYWQKSVSTFSSLPLAGNTLGDGRLAQDTAKPFMWNGTAWRDLFSSTDTTSVSIGPSSGQYGTWNTFIGQSSGNATQPDGVSNTMVGYQSGFSNTLGNNNVIVGSKAGFYNSTGSSNLFSGFQAGLSNTAGSNNVFTGPQAGFSNTTANSNVFSGFQAGYTNTTGENNIFTGSQAGYYNTTGGSNLFGGYQAGYFSGTGSNNIFTGSQAGYSNTNASFNIFSGFQAGYYNASGGNNTFTGLQSGYLNTSGYNNVFYGAASGYNNTIGYSNSALGSNAGPASGALINTTSIGSNAKATAPNSVVIGSGVTQIGGPVAWSNLSDRRRKTDIKDSSRSLDFIRKLRPVDYLLKDNKKPETGFIAQEVEEIDPDFPGIHKPQNDMDFYSLAYTDFIPSIVKSIQELDERNSAASGSAASTQKQASIINYLCIAVTVLGVICVVLFGMLIRVMSKVSKIQRALA